MKTNNPEAGTSDNTLQNPQPLPDNLHQALFKQLIDNIHEVFWVCSPDGRKVFFASRSYEIIWGRTIKDLYQNQFDWAESIHPLDRDIVKSNYLNLKNVKGFDQQYRIIRPDKDIRWIRDRGYPVYNDEGEVIHLVGMAQDITQYKILEEASKSHANLMEQKSIALKEMLNMFQSQKSEFEESLKSEIKSNVLPLLNQVKLAQSFQPKLVERLEKSISSLVSPIPVAQTPPSGYLSHKETEVANLISMGHSTKEIAALLNLSIHTITTYRYRLRTKLGIRNFKVGLIEHLRKNS